MYIRNNKKVIAIQEIFKTTRKKQFRHLTQPLRKLWKCFVYFTHLHTAKKINFGQRRSRFEKAYLKISLVLSSTGLLQKLALKMV